MVAYLARVWQLRYFWVSLVRIDLRNRYRRSVLGIGWSLLHPILMTAVLCTVFCPLFGADFRQFAHFSIGGHGLLVVPRNHGLAGLRLLRAGRSIHPAAGGSPGDLPFAHRAGHRDSRPGGFGVALLFTWYVHGFGNVPALISLIPTLVLIFLLGWSLALCCGISNVVFPDAQHLVEVLFQILFYLTPVMYPSKILAERRMEWLVKYNPLAAFLDLVRVPILEGRFPAPGSYAVALGLVVVLLGVATITLAPRTTIDFLPLAACR